MSERTFRKGAFVWFIPGYRDIDLIAIRCTIIEVSDYYKVNNKGSLAYWLDEPLGYSLFEHQLLVNRTEAEQDLQEFMNEEKVLARLSGKRFRLPESYTLDDWRDKSTRYLKSIKNDRIPEVVKKPRHHWITCHDL